MSSWAAFALDWLCRQLGATRYAIAAHDWASGLIAAGVAR